MRTALRRQDALQLRHEARVTRPVSSRKRQGFPIGGDWYSEGLYISLVTLMSAAAYDGRLVMALPMALLLWAAGHLGYSLAPVESRAKGRVGHRRVIEISYPPPLHRCSPSDTIPRGLRRKVNHQGPGWQ